MNMNKPPNLEAPATREMALEAARKFSKRGITNPDKLDLGDPEVKKAHELFDKWRTAEETRVKGDSQAEHRLNLALTMFYVDAGFTDSDYLEDIAEFLDNDLHDAEETPELAGLIPEIKTQIERVANLLDEN